MSTSCKEEGKQLSKQHYLNPNISTMELRNPATVVNEQISSSGAIIIPTVYSPRTQYNVMSAYSGNRNLILLDILRGLVTAEQVARRQYDELLMLPETKGYENDLLYIRNDEHEHEMILNCMIKRLTLTYPQQPKFRDEIYKGALEYPAEQPVQQPNVAILTPKGLGELYGTILDRFGEEEEKSVKNYEEFLVKVQQSNEALETALKKGTISEDDYNAVVYSLRSLQQKINKHLNEERVHLDVIDALQDMFENMKLGKAE